jgi:Dolichyl-phosphate-mannose-protein mannosyltransferase
VSRRALLPLSFLFLLVALGIAVSGGFVGFIAGRRVSAHDPSTAMLAALVAAGLWLVAALRQRSVRSDLDGAWEWMERRAQTLVVIIAATSAAMALHFGTFSATGSDASGYLSEAALLWARRLFYPEPLSSVADWAAGPMTLVPLGWRPALTAGLQVPSYAPGLPVLMAIPHGLAGTVGACAVAACAAGLAVWACASLATRAFGSVAGIVAAVWLATSPTFLVQSFQPMSDVPVTAAWLACWVLLARATGALSAPSAPVAPNAPVVAGLIAALAILIRPNLAPLAVITAAYLFAAAAPSLRARLRRVIAFSIPIAIAGLFVAWLQARWYGSPLMSGYGSAAEIYSWSNLRPNLTRYGGWLADIESPLLLLAAVAWWHPGSRLLRWCLAFAACVVLAYALYLVVEQWTYLRFLLPAMAIAIAAASAGIVAALERLPTWSRALVIAALIPSVAAYGLVHARKLGVFAFAEVHARAVLAGRYLEPLLLPNAVVIAGEQSGSIRYYTGRSIVRWDLLAEDGLIDVLDTLRRGGLEPWIVLDAWEEEPFRARFRNVSAGAIDWPPVVDAGRDMRTRAWRIADRARFVAGERLRTDRLR